MPTAHANHHLFMSAFVERVVQRKRRPSRQWHFTLFVTGTRAPNTDTSSTEHHLATRASGTLRAVFA